MNLRINLTNYDSEMMNRLSRCTVLGYIGDRSRYPDNHDCIFKMLVEDISGNREIFNFIADENHLKILVSRNDENLNWVFVKPIKLNRWDCSIVNKINVEKGTAPVFGIAYHLDQTMFISAIGAPKPYITIALIYEEDEWQPHVTYELEIA